VVSAVGRRLPAHCTAVGKMLLSSLDPADLGARLPAGDLPGMTPDSPERLAVVAGGDVPDLHAAVRHLAADGVLRVDPGRAGGGRAGRRLQPHPGAPVVIMYAFGQRFLTGGLAAGPVKG
jgi:hypothetical protein